MTGQPSTDEIDAYLGRCLRRLLADPRIQEKSHALISTYARLLAYLLLCCDESNCQTFTATLTGRDLGEIAGISMGHQNAIFDTLEQYGYIHVERKPLHPRYRNLRAGTRSISLVNLDFMEEIFPVPLPSLEQSASPTLSSLPPDDDAESEGIIWINLGDQTYQAKLIDLSPVTPPTPYQKKRKKQARLQRL